MRRACDKGARVFDFGRSKLGTGAFAYKRIWGFEPQHLHHEYLLLRRRRDAQRQPAQSASMRFLIALLAPPASVRRQRARPADLPRPGVRRLAEILFLAHRIPFPPDQGRQDPRLSFPVAPRAHATWSIWAASSTIPATGATPTHLRRLCARMPLRRPAASARLAARRGRARCATRRSASRSLRDPALAGWIGGSAAAPADRLRVRLFVGDGAVPAGGAGTRRCGASSISSTPTPRNGGRWLPYRPWPLVLALSAGKRAGLRAFDRDAAGAVRSLPVRLAGRGALVPGADPGGEAKDAGDPERRRQRLFLAGGRAFRARSRRAARCSPSPAT